MLERFEKTIAHRAEEAWRKYGRIDRRGRCYLREEYIGRLGQSDQGTPMWFRPGVRKVGYLTVDGLPQAYIKSR